MAASAFVPIMQYHSEFNHRRRPSRDRTPWNIAEQAGDTGVIAEARAIVELRERLIPYLREQARVAIAASRPLMRPLYFDWPDDPGVWEHPVEWKLGDHILVAPVLRPGSAPWPVYLPEGDWVDAWSGERVRGGGVVQAALPRHRAPAFVTPDAWPGLAEVFGSLEGY
jgi:alpha-glucosidase (family GH31 glycosyl hydrolase)